MSLPISPLSRHWLGGGGRITPTPLANFLIDLKTKTGIDAKLPVPYSASIWHPQAKFQQSSSRSFLRKWRFSDVMSRDFGSKIGQHSNASRMQTFKVKRNRQTPKDVKLHSLQKTISDFDFIFDPQKSKFRFFKNKI